MRELRSGMGGIPGSRCEIAAIAVGVAEVQRHFVPVLAVDFRIGFEGHAAGVDLYHELVVGAIRLEIHVQLGKAGPILLGRV